MAGLLSRFSFYFCFIISTNSILDSPIEYLKGVGPQRADLLKKELGIFTFRDLLEHFPFRHVDKTRVQQISEAAPDMEYIQVAGKLMNLDLIGDRYNKRLVGQLMDKSGILELAWFQGASWIRKALEPGREYLVFGRLGFYKGKPQLVHPEMELLTPEKKEGKAYLEPVYPATEKLKARGLGGRQLGKLTATLLGLLDRNSIPEILPNSIIEKAKLPDRLTAFREIHFPSSTNSYQQALKRLKLEELLVKQLTMQRIRMQRHLHSRGVVFERVGELFNRFYKEKLPFELTNAQKRVIREIRQDLGSGHQMNRLLQGDVGSGKTMVALLLMLLAADNGYQSCLMAPTEILARQHAESLESMLEGLPVKVRLLTGSTRTAARKEIASMLESGELQILIGTHAVIEEGVRFRNLALAIIDEQHRFGVAQRARLWEKASVPPHILVMTATPIPRTLAMTAYGDLDYSVIDELPPGRQPITTVHRAETSRHRVMQFIKEEIRTGRQAYIIFPLIEESAKLDYENLQKGYEQVKSWFPEPKYWISMVHGRQPAALKETNMKRFASGDTQIMVSTTVIEVGVNVPNATVMVIESAEKFGLSQLHQLRGRVGRGSEKSYCILLTPASISADARERMNTMMETNDGFLIAEKDLALRGPGDIEGTRQSGTLNFKLADLVKDRQMLESAGKLAATILENDPELESAENLPLKNYFQSQKGQTAWSRIS